MKQVSKILLKQARVVDQASSWNGQQVDVLIENDQVKKIGHDLSADDAELVEAENLHISPGWFDLRANFFDPGNEERETLESGINAAARGGFTGVALSCETNPVIDSKADIEYIYQACANSPVNLFPMGAITKGLKGEELSEMYDMYQAGAVAFSHGKKPLKSSVVTKVALQYANNFAPPLHLFCLEPELAMGGQMHEGEISTYLGLKGIPELAEEIDMLRNIHLADYAETGIHLMGISSAAAVEILHNGTKDGSYLSADVAVANLIFSDSILENYDSNYKVLPPLRSEGDRLKLLEALRKGWIKVICSDHTPVDIERKKCEFEQADWGMISLETLFGSLGHFREELPLEKLIECITCNPRDVLMLESPTVEEGSWAEFTLFDPDEEWVYQRPDIESRSHNSPLIGKTLKGRALGTINNGMMIWLRA